MVHTRATSRTAARLMLSGILIASTSLGAAATPRTASGVAAPSNPFPDGRTVVRDRFSVEIVGRGPDVVLVPGIASSAEVWKPTVERLRSRYRLHVVRIAGFAGEPARANATGEVFRPLVAGLRAYVDGLGRPVSLVGHSMGGGLVLAVAETHPKNLARLMIVDALPFFGTLVGGPGATPESVGPTVETIVAGLDDRSDAKLRAAASQMATAPADVDRLVSWNQASDPAVVREATRDYMLTDSRSDLSALKLPVTILYEAPLKAAMQAGYMPLPTARLVEIPGARHFVMLDQPDSFATALDAFLSGRPAG